MVLCALLLVGGDADGAPPGTGGTPPAGTFPLPWRLPHSALIAAEEDGPAAAFQGSRLDGVAVREANPPLERPVPRAGAARHLRRAVSGAADSRAASLLVSGRARKLSKRDSRNAGTGAMPIWFAGATLETPGGAVGSVAHRRAEPHYACCRLRRG